jgi:peptide/nickel transport system ATP-binding protein
MPVLVEIKGLKKYFDTPKGQLHAVDDVSMVFNRGMTMGVVGESGCGKSTLGRTIIHLLESTDGRIFFEGRDVTSVKSRELAGLRQRMQIVFQDPYSSLNPRYTVEETFKEPLLLSGRANNSTIGKEIKNLMDLVGIAGRHRKAFPHEMDGGQRQRVGIGRALAMNPSFIVCDEPVSALDVSIQAQIINLLLDLQKNLGLTYMFVTHDLSVVRYISDNISVMYLGQLVETSASDELFENPLHPYTRALLSAIPSTDIHRKKERVILRGEITSPINPKLGCRFATRCLHTTGRCHEGQRLDEIRPGHFVSCCRAGEITNTGSKQGELV